MTPNPPPLPQEPQPPPPCASSLAARLFNVFATPGDVFEEVAASAPCHANWLTPVFLVCLAGLVSVFVIFSQETIIQQLRAQQEQALEKKLQHLPKEQREQAKATIEKFTSPALLKGFGAAGAVVGSFAWVLATALFVWLAGRFVFKADFPFLKSIEVCGLASMIGLLGVIVGTLLIVGKGQMMASLSPALLISDFTPANPVHQSLAACNVITFWHIAVLAIGLAKLSRASVIKTLPCLFIPWAIFKFGLIWLGIGQT
jgi:hypothetical protein